jgi:quercetin dioxygenase-like cupin family protein
MFPRIVSKHGVVQVDSIGNSPAKRKRLFYVAAVGLSGMIAAAALTGCMEQVVPAPPAQATALAAPTAKVTPLFSKDLKDFPGKEGVMISVEYPPGSVDAVHRHNAHAFLYVLEGSSVMQLKGGKEMTLKPRDTFYEGPDDIHTIGRNASKTEPARFVVFFVKDKGAPVVIPEK